MISAFDIDSGPRLVRFRHTSASAAVEELYAASPGLRDKSFLHQQAAIDELHLSFTGGLVDGLRHLGYNAVDILYDVPQLQAAWEREVGIDLGSEDRARAFAFSVIAEFKPSIVLEQSFGLFRSMDLERIRATFPFVKVQCMHVGFPLVGYPVDFGKSSAYDVMFTTCPNFVEDFRDAGIRRVEVIPHGFDASVLPLLEPQPRDLPLVFAGSSGFGYGETHWSRYRYLEELCSRTPIQCYLQEPNNPSGGEVSSGRVTQRGAAARAAVRVAKQRVKERLRPIVRPSTALANKPRRSLVNRPPLSWTSPVVPLQELFPAQCHGPVFGMDMYRVMNRARLTFHRGHDVEGSCSSALRLYEATGVGSALVTNYVDQLPGLFEIDREIVAYESVSECVEKVNYLLDNPSVAADIAAAGQRKTLENYTLAHRAGQFDEVFRSLL